jgi:hypothetical protein
MQAPRAWDSTPIGDDVLIIGPDPEQEQARGRHVRRSVTAASDALSAPHRCS